MDKVIKEMQVKLATAGFKSAIVSTDHLEDLQSDFSRLLAKGDLQQSSYDALVSRYETLQQTHEIPDDFSALYHFTDHGHGGLFQKERGRSGRESPGPRGCVAQSGRDKRVDTSGGSPGVGGAGPLSAD